MSCQQRGETEPSPAPHTPKHCRFGMQKPGASVYLWSLLFKAEMWLRKRHLSFWHGLCWRDVPAQEPPSLPRWFRGHPMISSGRRGRHQLFVHCPPGREAHPAEPKPLVPGSPAPPTWKCQPILVEDLQKKKQAFLLSMMYSEIKNKTFKGLLQRKKGGKENTKFSVVEKKIFKRYKRISLYLHWPVPRKR